MAHLNPLLALFRPTHGFPLALHFKLSVSDPEHKGFDAAEFQYTPLLDSNRDRDLIDMLPDYLAVDITFSRKNAAKFYGRVVDTLTKRRADR